MEVLSQSTQDTKKLASQLAQSLKTSHTILLYGELGSGKTTFTGYLCEALGVEQKVQSPTFVIHRIYKPNNENIKIIHHLDLYRLVTMQELKDIGIVEILADKSALTIVEWPDKFPDFWSDECLKIKFEDPGLGESTRKIYVQNIH